MLAGFISPLPLYEEILKYNWTIYYVARGSSLTILLSIWNNLMQNLSKVTLWQGEYEYFPLLKSQVMIDFNCNAIRTFYMKLIFIDDVGLGREHRIKRWKPWEYMNMLLQLFMQIKIPSSFSISRIKD